MIKSLFSALTLVSLLTTGQADVVINEIFYNSPADLDRLEFIELHNTSSESVSLDGWEFSKGIEFAFPKEAKIEAGGFWVVCGDQDLFKEFYGVDADGVFSKGLDNGGETITLKNADGKKVDSVKYDDDAPWPKSPDGYSASLERICPGESNSRASNWAPSVLSDDYERKPSGTPGKQNSTYAATLPPVIDDVTSPQIAKPNESLTIRASISDPSLTEAQLCYRIVRPGKESEETEVAMKRHDDHTYVATIPGAEANRIVRFRVKAINKQGEVRYHPHQNAIRPALSVYVDGGIETGNIPVAQFFNVGEAEFKAGAEYRSSHAQSRGRGGRGGFDERREPSPEERVRRSIQERLSSDALEKAWTEFTLKQSLNNEQMLLATKVFGEANTSLVEIRQEAETAKDIDAFANDLDTRLTTLRETLEQAVAESLTASPREALAAFGKAGEDQDRGRGGRRFGNPADMLLRFFNVEESWFRCAMIEGLSTEQSDKLAEMHKASLEERGKLVEGDDIDFREVFGNARDLQGDLSDAIAKVLSEDQFASAFGRDRRERGGDRRGPGGRGASQQGPALRPQGQSAFIYTDPESKQPRLFDFVNITPRKSGHKVRLHKDQPLNGMTTLNILYEGSEGSTLNEALAYELYRQTGNATTEAGFMRVIIDGQLAGYHLWFEQPNGNFFRRNEISDKGNLYKLIWMGSHRPSKYTPEDKIPERMDIVGKHEKKTHPHDGYDDIVSLIETLEGARDDDEKMWQVIQEHFDVDQVINYFAVNSLLSHWDGFFNNYFLYHDVKKTKKWSMYPWDQDSTWSQRMGNPESLSTLPLNYGAEGARPAGAAPPRDDDRDRGRRGRGGFRGFGGGRGAPGWWRDGGDVSKPLLANPHFYERFRARLKVLTETVFTDDVFGPKIDAVRANIEPEVRLRAESLKQNPDDAVRDFQETMDVFNEHLKRRRAFVLQELENG